MARLFGTDGVRGEANLELTPELAYRLGRAATLFFGEDTQQPVILIGRDTRISGKCLKRLWLLAFVQPAVRLSLPV